MSQLNDGVDIHAPITQETEQVLTPDAREFLVALERKFGERRRALLKKRVERQARLTRDKTRRSSPKRRASASIRRGT